MKILLIFCLCLLSVAPVLAQSINCPNNISANSCDSRTRNVINIQNNLDRSNAKLIGEADLYNLVLQEAEIRHDAEINETNSDKLLNDNKCQQSYVRSSYNINCGADPEKCSYKEGLVQQKYDSCLAKVAEREQRSAIDTENDFATQVSNAKSRYDKQVASLQSRISRDQIRLSSTRAEEQFCLSCL